jgi:DNA-binding CsgD family transcriptional regulator
MPISRPSPGRAAARARRTSTTDAPAASTANAGLDAIPSPAPTPPASAAAASAGEWRRALRGDVGAGNRWRLLAEAAEAVQTAADGAAPRIARAAALDAGLAAALRLLAVQDGVVLALRGDRWEVVAGRGRALPPGASLPGAWPGPPAEVLAARASRPVADWWLGTPPPGMRTAEAAITGPTGLLGVLSVALTRSAVDEDDRRTLTVLATLLGAALAEAEPAAPRRPRRSDPRLAALTRRERQVLALVARGLSNADIGRELGVAAGTAKVHVERILRKLQVSDRTQAAVIAARHGGAA